LERGKTAYQENKFGKAIEMISQLLSHNPTNLEGNYLMAISLMGRNEFAKAIHYFDIVIEIDAHYNKNVFILYAICCKKLSLSDQSIKKVIDLSIQLSTCIELFPEYYDAYIYRGKLKLK
jgi:tetratricopeptide (TPR) repeat protein